LGISFEGGSVGGIQGWWCRPEAPLPNTVLMFTHGGGFVLGTAGAFRNFAGQVAARLNVKTFIPDYRLAPEHPFPAAFEDVRACYHDLSSGGAAVLLVGDSAGGGLTLALLSALHADNGAHNLPLAAAVMSPWTELSLTSETMDTRAEADPIFTKDALFSLSQLYLAGADPRDPRASPLNADLDGLPPIRIDVGDDEILLGDSTRYAAAGQGAGSPVELHVWAGMSHVFPSSVGSLRAADAALDGIAEFLGHHLHKR
jgi:acetyl esterase/lipase